MFKFTWVSLPTALTVSLAQTTPKCQALNTPGGGGRYVNREFNIDTVVAHHCSDILNRVTNAFLILFKEVPIPSGSKKRQLYDFLQLCQYHFSTMLL